MAMLRISAAAAVLVLAGCVPGNVWQQGNVFMCFGWCVALNEEHFHTADMAPEE